MNIPSKNDKWEIHQWTISVFVAAVICYPEPSFAGTKSEFIRYPFLFLFLPVFYIFASPRKSIRCIVSIFTSPYLH